MANHRVPRQKKRLQPLAADAIVNSVLFSAPVVRTAFPVWGRE